MAVPPSLASSAPRWLFWRPRPDSRALYFSGAAFSGLLGLPDLGVTTLTEVADAVSQITSRVDLPMIVDVDTGFGEAVNMGRTVDEMERVGAAAIQVEDQVMPKRCGHLDGKQLVERGRDVEEARSRTGRPRPWVW